MFRASDHFNSLGAINLNYLSLYKKLIRKCKKLHKLRRFAKKNGEYFENHHIIPECELKRRGRKPKIIERKWNKVLLTAREHFIAHMFLWKACIQIYGDKHRYTRSTFFAVDNFRKRNASIRANYKITSRTYEFLRQESMKLLVGRIPVNKGIKQPEHGGKNHWNYGNRDNRIGNNHSTSKVWKLGFDDGTFEIVDDLNQWCIRYGYQRSNIAAVFYNRRKYHKDIISVLELNKT